MRERRYLGWSLRRIAFVGVLAAAVLLGTGAAPASAVGSNERIDTYDVAMVVDQNAELRVTETIAYDFGFNAKHGIFRDIPVSYRYNDTKNRVYPIENVRVTRDGNREPHQRIDEDSMVRFKVGDPNETITGRHTYVISYTVRGALTRFDDHDELFWDAIGDGWRVPIAAASVTVQGPTPVTKVDCFAGPVRSKLGCDSDVFDGQRASFRHGALSPGEAFSVVVAFPPDSIAGVGPVLEDRRDVAAAFRPTALAVAGAIGAGLLGTAVALFVAYRIGRDRVYVGQIPTLAPVSGQETPQRRKALWGAPPVTVQFTPPQGIKPGEVGTLLDEQVNTVDVTATIVDFAVRRYLRITEITDDGAGGAAQDWELTKLAEADDSMAMYEKKLFKALFKGGNTVKLSSLKQTFATSFQAVKRGLYDSVVQRGWYRESPKLTRSTSFGFGVFAIVVAIIATAVLFWFTHVALIGVGLIVAAVVGLISTRFFPARTGRGTVALNQVLGFRQYLATAEAGQITFEEREQVFSRYLPYAIVFG
ncbi:MAG: DUF2207 domain-containing protein, partial [Mycobacteriales bacterium]